MIHCQNGEIKIHHITLIKQQRALTTFDFACLTSVAVIRQGAFASFQGLLTSILTLHALAI